MNGRHLAQYIEGGLMCDEGGSRQVISGGHAWGRLIARFTIWHSRLDVPRQLYCHPRQALQG